MSFSLSGMTQTVKNLSRIALITLTFCVVTSVQANIVVPTCGSEPCYSGGGISEGISDVAGGIGGISTSDPRTAVLNVLTQVISFMALAAVVVIVIAGIYLIFSNGEDTQKDKAKKIIFYVILGLIVIAIASLIVRFVIAVTMSSGS